MSKFEVEMYWPLVIFRVGDAMTTEDHQALISAWERVLEKKERFVGISDVRRVRQGANEEQRAMIGGWMRKIDAQVSKYLVATCSVSEAPAQREMLKAIRWIHSPDVPIGTFGTLSAACDWCIEQLQEAGVAVSPELLAYRATLGNDFG